LEIVLSAENISIGLKKLENCQNALTPDRGSDDLAAQARERRAKNGTAAQGHVAHTC